MGQVITIPVPMKRQSQSVAKFLQTPGAFTICIHPFFSAIL